MRNVGDVRSDSHGHDVRVDDTGVPLGGVEQAGRGRVEGGVGGCGLGGTTDWRWRHVRCRQDSVTVSESGEDVGAGEDLRLAHRQDQWRPAITEGAQDGQLGILSEGQEAPELLQTEGDRYFLRWQSEERS